MMKDHDITEQAYKNGYVKGYEDGKADAVKHGTWTMITHSEYSEVADYECSVCGVILVDVPDDPKRELNPYCPMCGARMDGERETDG